MCATCTADELFAIVTAPANGLTLLPSTSYDEVYPNLYLGDESIAKQRQTLKRLGITHILNCAYGDTVYHVNIPVEFYKPLGIKLLQVDAIDTMNCDISKHFYVAADFIENGLKHGKVLVHCREGVSRSATLVISFLMIRCQMTAHDAVRLVRKGREIAPNMGFLHQLCILNDRLTSVTSE